MGRLLPSVGFASWNWQSINQNIREGHKPVKKENSSVWGDIPKVFFLWKMEETLKTPRSSMRKEAIDEKISKITLGTEKRQN